MLIEWAMLSLLGLASSPPAAPVRIAEASARDDWVEIANLGGDAISLDGWRVRSRNGAVELGGEIGSNDRIVVPLRVAKKNDRLELVEASRVVDRLELPRQRSDASYGRDAAGGIGFFAEPTPGAPPKGPVLRAIAAVPRVRPSRGIFSQGIDVSVTHARYTIDGTDPIRSKDAVSRLRIRPASGAVVLRAVREEPGLLASEEVSHTYVVPEAVFRQDGAGFPPTWGTGPSSTTADYAMRRDAACGLAALPTISIAIDPLDLFDPVRGIYANPGHRKERRANVEMLPFRGDPGFSMQAGLRIQGGSSTRRWKSRKLSLRLRFAKEYGGRLEHRLFPGRGGDRFANLVLDAQLNLTWIHPDPEQRAMAQYVRDAFVADLIRELGGVAPRGRFVHLYLAGLYWGVYFLHERPDQHFAAAQIGGARKDWEVARHGPRWVSGKGERWKAMIGLARGGLADEDRYRAFAKEHLDVDAFIDYLLVNFWAGNEDWPANNWYGGASSTETWRFFTWDAERVLTDPSIERTRVADLDSPGELFDHLMKNDEFRRRLLHRAQVLLRGKIGAKESLRIYLARIAELRPAIACEAARWGDARGDYGKRDWERELARLRREWFPRRSAIVRQQIELLVR